MASTCLQEEFTCLQALVFSIAESVKAIQNLVQEQTTSTTQIQNDMQEMSKAIQNLLRHMQDKFNKEGQNQNQSPRSS